MKTKRLLCIILTLCMLLSSAPMMSISSSAEIIKSSVSDDVIYAKLKDNVQEGNIHVWFEGLDGSVNNFRTAQTIVVKSSGFSKRADLVYTYHWKNNSIFGDLEVLTINGDCAGRTDWSGENSVLKSRYNRFAITGFDAYSKTVTVTVTDENPYSSTYKLSETYSWKGFKSSSLYKDSLVSFAMFEDDKTNAKQLMSSVGINHFKNCSVSYVNNFKILQNNGVLTYLPNGEIKATKAGVTKVYIDICKYFGCTYHGNSNASGYHDLKVFKNPEYIAEANTVTLTNTEKGVTYSIGDYVATCTRDNQKIVFNGLWGGQRVELVCSVYVNGNEIKKSMSISLPNNLTLNKIYNYSSLLIRIDDSLSIPFEKNTVVERPDDPVLNGYLFDNWYDDAGYTKEHDFSVVMNESDDIYGRFIPLKSTAAITLMIDNKPCSGKKVQLYKLYIKRDRNSRSIFIQRKRGFNRLVRNLYRR